MAPWHSSGGDAKLVEEVDDPLMQKIRYLDKLIDELAKGRLMEKILRVADEPKGKK